MTSIVTVTYNSYRCLQRLRRTLREHTRDYRWIVVDNGSPREETHRELDEIERLDEADVIRLPENLWFTRGVNAGLAKAGGDPIVLLNPDCAVTPRWLEMMLATARRPRRRIGLVGAVLVNEVGMVVHAGGMGYGAHEGYGATYDVAAPWAQERPHAGWITGACLMISRDALDAVGSLDEQWIHFHSDRIVAERARAAGFEVWMSPAVLVHSVGGCQQ